MSRGVGVQLACMCLQSTAAHWAECSGNHNHKHPPTHPLQAAQLWAHHSARRHMMSIARSM